MNNRIKYDIVIAVTNDLSSDQRMYRISQTLVDQGKRVLLIGSQKKESVSLSDKPFDQKRISTFFKAGPLFYLEYNLRLWLILISISSKKMYAVDLDTIMAVATSARILGLPFIFDAHEDFAEVPELTGRPLKKSIWQKIGQFFIPKAEKRITVNESLAKIFTKRYDVSFTPIYNLPISYDVVTKEKSESFIVIYQGKINKGRGVMEMIKAMHLLPNQVELWIIGDGDLASEVTSYLDYISNDQRVKLLGWMSREEMQKHTQKAHLGINLLSDNSLSYYYSSANKVYDYIMAEVPILTMDFPEYRALNEKYDVGYLIGDINQETIAKKIKDILNNNEHYQLKVNNCNVARKDLCWEKEKQKLDLD